jgi:hypothetical protein
VLGVVVLGPAPALAESPEITADQWKMLTKAVRLVKRDYVTAVDDAKIARGCADRVYALPPASARGWWRADPDLHAAAQPRPLTANPTRRTTWC